MASVEEVALAEEMECGEGALACSSARKEEFGRLVTSRRIEVWLDIRELPSIDILRAMEKMRSTINQRALFLPLCPITSRNGVIPPGHDRKQRGALSPQLLVREAPWLTQAPESMVLTRLPVLSQEN